jgi:amino-acid N-acetyltransferase
MPEPLLVADGRKVVLRSAATTDLRKLLRLLAELQLPAAGVEEWWPHFTVADSGGVIVGVAGIEPYGSAVLLRSVAVAPAWRNCGLAQALVAAVLDTAIDSGAGEVFLLTTTAEGYFPRLGFTPIPRDLVPRAILDSVEFREACPVSAIVMHRRLGPRESKSTSTPARTTR